MKAEASRASPKNIIISLILSVIAFASAAPLAAEEGPVLSWYEAKSISVGYALFSGLTLSNGGQVTGTGMGLSPRFENLLAACPESAAALDEYRNKNTTGNLLLWGGLAAQLGATVLPLFFMSGSGSVDGGSYALVASTATLGGLVMELVGALLVPMGYQDLLNSVNAYNRYILAEFDAAGK